MNEILRIELASSLARFMGRCHEPLWKRSLSDACFQGSTVGTTKRTKHSVSRLQHGRNNLKSMHFHKG